MVRNCAIGEGVALRDDLRGQTDPQLTLSTSSHLHSHETEHVSDNQSMITDYMTQHARG